MVIYCLWGSVSLGSYPGTCMVSNTILYYNSEFITAIWCCTEIRITIEFTSTIAIYYILRLWEKDLAFFFRVNPFPFSFLLSDLSSCQLRSFLDIYMYTYWNISVTLFACSCSLLPKWRQYLLSRNHHRLTKWSSSHQPHQSQMSWDHHSCQLIFPGVITWCQLHVVDWFLQFDFPMIFEWFAIVLC